MLKIVHAKFVTSAPSLNEAPQLGLPEFALVGRSNVGKSSFINKILNRKNLARTSNTPGKTRLLNFYEIDESWALVDLPGYGYAKVSKTMQQAWRQNMEQFLLERQPLVGVFQMIDARHGPQNNDLQMFEWLCHHRQQPMCVVTKLDKLPRSKRPKALKEARQALGVKHVFGFSAETGEGVEEVLKTLERLLQR